MAKAYSYVRISSKVQAKGDGVRRQLDVSRAYAEKTGLVLDEELTDIGLSAYHGKHKAIGALGGFLDLVAAGKIEPGSILIVESLDRLSRENPVTAQSQLLDILSADIDVVTLNDNQRYSKGNDATQLIISLTVISRAHEESKTKSLRLKAAAAKRKTDILAGQKRYVTNPPMWLTNVQTNGQWDCVVNKFGSFVREMFELYDSGLGGHSIARLFNERGVPTFKSSTSDVATKGVWYSPTIMNLLKHEAAIGSYRAGDQVAENYFPAVVDRDLFYRVQDRLKSQNNVRRGRKGESYTNLLQNLAVCHHCGHAIRLNRGGVKNKVLYLSCQTRFIGSKCSSDGRKFLPYQAFEDAILRLVMDYYIDQSKGGNKSKDAILTDLTTYRQNRGEMAKRIANIRASVETAEDNDDRISFMTRLNDLRKDTASVDAKIEGLERQLRDFDETDKAEKSIHDEIRSEVSKWASMSKDELFISRSKIAHNLRRVITTVQVDVPKKQVIVAVGGLIRWWIIGADGTVRTTGDWSTLPFDILVARSKEFFGDRIDVNAMRAVYDRIDVPRADPALWDNERAARGLARSPR
ncbi:recombinase family protein [Agrobacterium tumefaciens]|uniref:recombinase family protein n=1 Tax=Agrobacterium TaxID=357 RepID=UPI00115CEE5E|nr:MULTISPECIES: recombinase family protein [Agrobacterium]MDA5241149.1 recombinase family protein [Agrobacterium sp. MAFF310724]MDA5249560.1 recombinase family protein [Agrobacterium sp. MAFF210268]TRB12377.1 recombinase family protein [Agrobacterium tumefaciens]